MKKSRVEENWVWRFQEPWILDFVAPDHLEKAMFTKIESYVNIRLIWIWEG